MQAYFEFLQASPEGEVKRFIFKLEDQKKIDEARNIIKTEAANSRVKGTIVPKWVPYNPEWSFHLAPESIGFFEVAVEVCDANVTYVEEHLSEIGGDTLPNNFWCPWSSKLSIEVTEKIDPKTEIFRGI